MCSQWSSKQRIRLNLPISAFYPHFSVLSPFQRFIPISAFYPHFSVLSPFQRFIPISAFYPHFSVLSPFQRFIPISAFYPHFSFRFQFPFPRFSFSVLSLPYGGPEVQNTNQTKQTKITFLYHFYTILIHFYPKHETQLTILSHNFLFF